jgi:chaperonin GroES
MKLKAHYDKVIAKVIEEGETRLGKIIIPDMGKERPEFGEVVSVGAGFYVFSGELIPLGIEVGQKILIQKFGSQVITINNEDYIVCKGTDVLAIIEE